MEDVVAAGHKCQFVCLLLDFKRPTLTWLPSGSESRPVADLTNNEPGFEGALVMASSAAALSVKAPSAEAPSVTASSTIPAADGALASDIITANGVLGTDATAVDGVLPIGVTAATGALGFEFGANVVFDCALVCESTTSGALAGA